MSREPRVGFPFTLNGPTQVLTQTLETRRPPIVRTLSTASWLVNQRTALVAINWSSDGRGRATACRANEAVASTAAIPAAVAPDATATRAQPLRWPVDSVDDSVEVTLC
jgi:hypothetical protein